MKLYITLLFFTAALITSGCSGGISVLSLPSGENTVIDGNTSEWNNLTSIKNEKLAIGFRNDKDYLYIAMVTNDRSKIMKIITGGLEVWLEPGDSDSKIGIRYPERPDPSDMMRFREQNRNTPENGDNPPPPDLGMQNTITILSEDGTELKQFPADGNTYKSKITINRESFSYELRVPIGANISSPDGLKINNDDNINVEFITGDFNRDMMRRRSGDGTMMPPPDGGGSMGGGPGGGSGGPGGPGGGPGSPGGGPGGHRGPGGGPMSQKTGPLNYTFEVKLSK